ncbi:Hsp20/alpha crystallin family protein [bacterium]|nr:Hsp20/alpha crystallin family protein [bacterium]
MKKLLKRISGLGSVNKSIDLREEEELEEVLKEEDEYYDENDDEVEETEEEEEEDSQEKEWLPDDYEEGQLSIDVYQTPSEIIVKSTIAGVKPEDIDISINNDMLTIRGQRMQSENIREENYLFRECYWGAFSRSIILPVEIKSDKIDATLENGVLTVVLPKAKTNKEISIKVKEK